MKQPELYHLIELQPEIVSKLDSAAKELDLKALEPCLGLMTERKTAYEAYERLKTLLGEDPDHIKMLACQLECACRIYHRYGQLQIEDAVYRDTMRCFTRFLDECLRKCGRMFFDRGWWTYRQISMSLFRIGTLEYEFPAQEEAGSIAIHIPSDADLSMASVDASLSAAENFFSSVYPDYAYDRYTCDSWLLAPALGSLLSGDSNIVSFQRRFTLTEETLDDSGCLEWLFGSPQDKNPENLPENTRLQRAAKKLLLSGGHIGAASGILRRTDIAR